MIILLKPQWWNANHSQLHDLCPVLGLPISTMKLGLHKAHTSRTACNSHSAKVQSRLSTKTKQKSSTYPCSDCWEFSPLFYVCLIVNSLFQIAYFCTKLDILSAQVHKVCSHGEVCKNSVLFMRWKCSKNWVWNYWTLHTLNKGRIGIAQGTSQTSQLSKLQRWCVEQMYAIYVFALNTTTVCMLLSNSGHQ